MDIPIMNKFPYIFKRRYLLFTFIIFPFITEYIENGYFPIKPREWITEIVMTIIIVITIVIIYRQYILLEKQSLLDHLTGIGNRRQFEIDLKREILRTNRMNTGLVLIFFDLDGFKEINDIYGHEQGDEVLVQFAQALSIFARKGSDFCYRFGGDEFAVLFTDINNEEIFNIENTIEERLSNITFSNLPIGVSASKGIVILKENENYDELLRRADDAMYQAKRSKKISDR
jgi:diguanylate cyclase (GGDEF)-like protein